MTLLSRRRLIAGAAGAAMASACRDRRPAPAGASSARARVAIVRGADLDGMARRALEAFGGAGAFVRRGDVVLVKPNFVFAGVVDGDIVRTGESVKPEIVIAVAEACLEAGAARVIVGEGAQVDRFDWSTLRTFDGASDLAAEAARVGRRHGGRLELACLNADRDAFEAAPAVASGLGRVQVARAAVRADQVVSLAVAKTHRVTGVTLGLKNLVGVASLAHHGVGGARAGLRLGLHRAGIDHAIVDIAAALRPAFTLVDCSVGCEGDGPRVEPGKHGTTVDLAARTGAWAVVASPDPVAADAVAARVMGHDPAAIPHLALAHAHGLGQLREELVTIDGPPIGDVATRFRLARPLDDVTELLRSL